MRYFKIIPKSGVFDEKAIRRITNALHGMPLNEGSTHGREGCLNWFRIDRIEKAVDGRVFTLTDSEGVPYVFKILNGFLAERIQLGELKTRAELADKKL